MWFVSTEDHEPLLEKFTTGCECVCEIVRGSSKTDFVCPVYRNGRRSFFSSRSLHTAKWGSVFRLIIVGFRSRDLRFMVGGRFLSQICVSVWGIN